MFGEVSYRKPNLVAQVAPKIANYIFAFNQTCLTWILCSLN
jgi:hypothetical protein